MPGLELEWLGGRIRGGRDDVTSITLNGTSTQSLESRLDWMTMATVRLGFVAADRLLVYGKAGFAVAHVEHTNDFSFIGSPGVTSTINNNTGDVFHTGVVLGGGLEYAFLRNWSANVEYNYIHFRPQDVFLSGTITQISPVLGTGTTSLPTSASLRQDLHLVKFGINYHFNPGEIITARY